MDDDTDSYENGQEISTNDGILLKKGPAFFLNEIANKTTGTLSLVHYVSNKLCIEWTPNDHIQICDAYAQGDWSFVDTITKRSRTASECLPSNNNSNNNNSGSIISQRDNSQIDRQQQQSPQNKQRVLRVRINDLKEIDVSKNGHIIRLVNKSDGKYHEFFFQNGNADGFVRTLQTTHCLQRSRNNKNQYEIVDNIEYDKEKLQKTFAELKIEDIKGGKGGWKNGIFGHTMDFFAKISDVYTILPGQSPQTSPTRSEQANNSIGTASNNDDYEVLSTSPRQCIMATAETSHSEIAEGNSKLPPRPAVSRGTPLSVKQWCEFMTEDGRVSDSDRVKEIIFRGGIEPSLRSEVWKYLLNYFQWDHTTEERHQHRKRKSQEYFQMKLQWLSMSQTQEKNFSDYRDRKCQIEKDVKRTDRTQEFFAGDDNPNLVLLQDILMTYVMYNFDLGYVQGMSDLLAPILYTMNNEADAFWCFVGFMDMVFTNFDMDQAGMKRQLLDLNKLVALANPSLFNYLTEHGSENMYFCFRWLLIWFKREFNQDDILELWEVLWTGLPCINFHLLVSVAILDDQKHIFMEQKYEFNEILKHVNELSLFIDLKPTLEKAEAIYLQLKNAENLTDDIRVIIGEEPMNKSERSDESDYDDNFDDIITVARDPKEDEQIQRKIDEACERSMYNSFY